MSRRSSGLTSQNQKKDLIAENQRLSLYEMIVEQQSDLVCRYDLDMRLTYVNLAFCRNFGKTKKQLLGSNILNLIVKSDRQKVAGQMQKLSIEQEQITHERRMILADGRTAWYSWTERALFDEKGEVLAFQAVGRDISVIKEAEEKIRYLQFHDSLTGSYNRAFFTTEMKRLDVVRQLPISIILASINGLKSINDTYGYSSGDRILINTSIILKACCREEDIVARYGGDQFAILLCGTGQKTAYEICDRIRHLCLCSEFDPVRPSLALGVATKDYKHKNINEVLSEAEDVMFRNKLLQSSSTRNSVISSLETTLHEKTTETREHAERIRSLSMEFGRMLGLDSDVMDRLALLAKLHDIGKIAVPEEILSKPGPLNSLEWDIIRKHPEIGYRITRSSRDLAVLAEEVLAHHERWDGGGYPRGLQGEGIPLLARVLSIVDAFDVMTHERSYKTAVSQGEALEEIMRCSGSQFDPDLAFIFSQMLN